jgi:hypothetical protein
MKFNLIKKVITSLAVAALFIVPMSFVVLQTSNSQTKNANAYNPYVNSEYYYGTNGTGQYYNSTFDYPSQNNYLNRYDPYNEYYDVTGTLIAVSDFNQPPIFNSNGNVSFSDQYKSDMNCSYDWSYNCSNFPLTPQPDYSVFVEQEPYILNVPKPKTYNYYDPYQENIQDPIKTWGYPEQNFDYDNGYYNS